MRDAQTAKPQTFRDRRRLVRLQPRREPGPRCKADPKKTPQRRPAPSSWEKVLFRLEGIRGSEGRKSGRIPVADAQADGNQTVFSQFSIPSLNSYEYQAKLEENGVTLTSIT